MKSIYVFLIFFVWLASPTALAFVDTKHLSPSGVQESCRALPVFPISFPEEKSKQYGDKDLENSALLCSIQLYLSRNTANFGVCPKIHNTQPAVEIYELPPETNKIDFETTQCHMSGASNGRKAKKIAKFKSSVYGFQTDSALAYFHLARLLGSKETIPTVTYRTMDASELKKLAAEGMEAGINPSIRKGWSYLMQRLNKGTSPQTMVAGNPNLAYGAFAVNPKGEAVNRIFHGSGVALPKLYSALLFSPSTMPEVINQLRISPSRAMQLAFMASDTIDLILLDFIFEQADRHRGNVHTRGYYIFRNKDHKISDKRLNSNEFAAYTKLAKKIKDPSTITAAQVATEAKITLDKSIPPNALVAERFLYKDNDDGFSGKRTFESDIKNLRHISPQTFRRLQWLAQLMNGDQQLLVQKYFTDEVGINLTPYAKMRKNILEIAAYLQNKVHQGTLKTDLDPELFLP